MNPDHQGLTDEQIELLRKMPYEVEPTDGIGNEIVLETKGLTHRHFRTFHMTPAGEVLLATLDHHTTKAKEDERRAITETVSGAATKQRALERDAARKCNLESAEEYGHAASVVEALAAQIGDTNA